MNSRKRIDSNVEKALKKIRELLLLNYSTGINLPEVKKALKSGEIFWFKDNPRAETVFEKKTSKNIASVEALIISLAKNAYNTGRSDAIATRPAIKARSKTGHKELELLKSEAVSSARGNTASTFVNEKRGGFTISDRVWRAGVATKKEMEVIIQNAIKEGLSADDISGKLRSYLNEPDKLFRRVKNKDTGKLEWSEAAKKYKPGRGVYRSAYKNAMRLARTEVNMAYRTAQWEQFKDDPTVIGFEVKLSNNHTLNGEPFRDICDELEGRYPKTFKFTGWHPQCRCNYFPIFITEDDFLNRIKARKEGKLDSWKPKQIEQLPAKFNDWLSKNKGRFRDGAKQPLFLQQNQLLLQEKGLIGKIPTTNLSAKGALLIDPLQVNSFLSLVDALKVKVAPALRKIAFESMLKNEKHERDGDVIKMLDAKFNETELQTAKKLTKAGYYVVFPSEGNIKTITGGSNKRINDVYLYDRRTFIQLKVEIKTMNEPSIKTIAAQIISGSGQANTLAIDVTGRISKKDLIQGLRDGWSKETRRVLLNYKGQWYQLDRKKVFSDWAVKNIK